VRRLVTVHAEGARSRLGVPQALLVSAVGFALATATERGNDMVLTMLRRGWPAIRNLGTLELIN
jgi:hypothetical protein